MSLWKRAPRAVYRVYDEDEYLAGEESPDVEESCIREASYGGEASSTREESDGGQAQAFVPPLEDPGGARFRRIGGIALLASATVVVAVLIATHSAHLSSAAPAAHAERGSEPARALSARRGARRPPVSHAVESGALSPSTHAIPRGTPQGVRRSHPMAAPARREASTRPATRLEQAATRVEEPASPAPVGEESSSGPPPPPPAAGAGAEFGFERS
jgi:hypothetical protein